MPSPFNYQHEATTLLPNSDFLSLPDHVTQYGPVRAQTLGLYIPESIQQWLLSGAPRIYDASRQLPDSSFVELTIHQFTSLLNARHAEDDKELDAARARSRLRRSSKRIVSVGLFPHVATKNQSKTKTQSKQHKKTPRKLGETLRFQKKSPRAAQYCFAMS